MSDSVAWVILGQLVVTLILFGWVGLLRQDLRHERTMREFHERMVGAWERTAGYWRDECHRIMGVSDWMDDPDDPDDPTATGDEAP
jgi:hypothetical protein